MTLALAGHVAIVTGVSKGIGRQIALEVVDELPTTSSGKVQQHVLRDAVAAKGRSA